MEAPPKTPKKCGIVNYQFTLVNSECDKTLQKWRRRLQKLQKSVEFTLASKFTSELVDSSTKKVEEWRRRNSASGASTPPLLTEFQQIPIHYNE